MLTPQFILFILAVIIIAALAGYALFLHREVKKKQLEVLEADNAERQLAQENLDRRNNSIISDIRFIAQALVTEQCEVTEGVLRIHHLADAIDADLMLQPEFSTLHEHFNQCKGMAIKEAYKELSKKQRFQQDNQRFRLEEQNKDNVLKEAKLLIKYSFNNLKKLH
jgi:hypothetical protein